MAGASIFEGAFCFSCGACGPGRAGGKDDAGEGFVHAAALLMAYWVVILARQDLLGVKMGRMLLFFIGCVLTFNLGRDITLITLYPFLFGYFMLAFWARTHGER